MRIWMFWPGRSCCLRLLAGLELEPQERQIDPVTSSVLAILIMLTLYPVGFPQYQMVLFVLATFWLSRDRRVSKRAKPGLSRGRVHFGWLAGFDVIESVINIDSLQMQEWVGLPTFLLECCLVAAIVQSAGGSSRARDRIPQRKCMPPRVELQTSDSLLCSLEAGRAVSVLDPRGTACMKVASHAPGCASLFSPAGTSVPGSSSQWSVP